MWEWRESISRREYNYLDLDFEDVDDQLNWWTFPNCISYPEHRPIMRWICSCTSKSASKWRDRRQSASTHKWWTGQALIAAQSTSFWRRRRTSTWRPSSCCKNGTEDGFSASVGDWGGAHKACNGLLHSSRRPVPVVSQKLRHAQHGLHKHGEESNGLDE